MIIKRFNLLTIFQFLLMLIVALLFMGCEKNEELPLYHAKGKIIAVTSLCYGEIVVIEVDNPKEIGLSGSFKTIGNEIDITYKNAIGVPYFSKLEIPDYVPQTIGTKLYFEFRELTEEERALTKLFSTDQPIICPTNIIPPSVRMLIIKKIMSYN